MHTYYNLPLPIRYEQSTKKTKNGVGAHVPATTSQQSYA